MKTIGQVLKEARTNKKISLDDLEFKTKIKKNFIRAIEVEDWEKLPTYSVVLGFVRSIAERIGVQSDFALALLRRDYPPKKEVKVSPTPNLENKVVWSPRLTFILGISIFLILILGYLGIQYISFISPPELVINKPKENEQVLSKTVKVEGKTDTDAKVEVNNQPVLVDQDGNFTTSVEISENTSTLLIKSTSRSGKETVIERKIKLDL